MLCIAITLGKGNPPSSLQLAFRYSISIEVPERKDDALAVLGLMLGYPSPQVSLTRIISLGTNSFRSLGQARQIVRASFLDRPGAWTAVPRLVTHCGV